MPTPEKVGEQIGKILLVTRKKSDRFFDSVQRELRKLNSLATREAARVYNQVLTSLITIEGTSVPKNDINNLSLISMLMQGIDTIQDGYRRRYSRLLQEARGDLIEITTEREFKVEKALSKIGINENRTAAGTETFELMEISNNQTLKKMNDILVKWRNFAYDTFYSGIVRGVPIAVFKSMFFNKDGSLRVGSSLDEETLYTTMTSIGEQRTSYIRGKAAELGYTYCWNANPMDPQTKSECIEATIAGVISEAEMSTGYGFPPRHICRCELVYTRPEWVTVNKGINSALEDRRNVLVQSLIDAPRQMASWKVAGKTIKATDITRLQGNLMYKETADKLNLLADRGAVPDFVPPGYLGVGEIPSVLPSSLPSVAGKKVAGVKEVSKVKSDYIPAKTIKELEDKFSKDLNIGYPSFSSKYSQEQALELGNQIAKHFDDLFTQFPKLKTSTAEGQQLFDMFFYKKTSFSGTSGASLQGEYNRSTFRIELAGSLQKGNSLTVGKNNWGTSNDLFTVSRHEFAHHTYANNLTSSTKKDFIDIWKDSGEKYFSKNVSKYAGSNIKEAFAESFSAYTSPIYKEGMLPKQIEKYFDDLYSN